MQMYEPAATVTAGCSSTLGYYCGPTNAKSITSPPDGTHAPGVWGHDEGPSYQMAAPAGDNRIVFYWGDSITAYNVSMTYPDAYQVRSCDGGMGNDGSCIGVDTVSYLSSADSANISTCTFLNDLDYYIIHGGTLPTYTGGAGHGGTCAKQKYIVDTSHSPTTTPYAAFTYQHVSPPLSTGQDMLGGHTATGAFALPVLGSTHTNSFIAYTVQSQKNAAFDNSFKVQDLLLSNHHTDTAIALDSIPTLKPLAALSEIPNGTAITDPAASTVTYCTGTEASFDTAWITGGTWKGFAIGGEVFPIAAYITPMNLTARVYVGIGESLPSTGSSCSSGNTVPYAAIPNQTTGPGKFLFAAPEYLSASFLSGQSWSGQLPFTGAAVCVWGSDYDYRQSNAYLGCMPADTAAIEAATNSTGAGFSAMYYLKGLDLHGNASWVQGAEAQAVPMLSTWDNTSHTPCIGELSVRWIPPLSLFLMTYGSDDCDGLQFRTSSTPWGPWSVETQFFSNNPATGWMERLIYASSATGNPDFNKKKAVWLTDPTTIPPSQINTESLPPYDQLGGPYGAYQLPGSTASNNGDGTYSIFMNLSGYNPYVTWQMAVNVSKP